MARNRASVQKRCNLEDTRRQTRRERLHQLCLDAANASMFNHNWMMDPALTVASDWHPNSMQSLLCSRRYTHITKETNSSP